MMLYHGSNQEVIVPDLSKCKKYKDFGQGFYLTTLKGQATDWAKKVAGRKRSGKPTLNEFEFPENKLHEINSISFEKPTDEWGLFIINNRNPEFKDYENRLSNQDNKYDLVHGLVANDDISAIFETFMLGILPLEELSKALKYKKLNDQYSFHTEKALGLLEFKKAEVISD
jgi:hypothetical protein